MAAQLLAYTAATEAADHQAMENGGGLRADDRIVEMRWEEQLARCTMMGFSAESAAEMLDLCDGDVEAAIQLLCS